MSAAAKFADPLTARLAGFVRGIGIEVRAGALPAADRRIWRPRT